MFDPDCKIKIVDRFEREESIRERVYETLDCANRDMSAEERDAWDRVHKALANLAHVYQSNGFKIWVH